MFSGKNGNGNNVVISSWKARKWQNDFLEHITYQRFAIINEKLSIYRLWARKYNIQRWRTDLGRILHSIQLFSNFVIGKKVWKWRNNIVISYVFTYIRVYNLFFFFQKTKQNPHILFFLRFLHTAGKTGQLPNPPFFF